MSETHEDVRRDDLSDYLAAVSRRWLLVASITVVATLAALLYSVLKTPVYTAEAKVLVPPPVGTTSPSSGIVVSAEEMATQKVAATSHPVAERAAERLGGDTAPGSVMNGVTATPISESRVLKFTADSTSADEAKQKANAVARAYLAYAQNQIDEGIEKTVQALSESRTKLTDSLDQVTQKLKTASGAEKTRLQTEQAQLQTQIGQLDAQLQTATTGAVVQSSNGQLLSSASTPESPSSPRTVLNTVLGFALGLLLAIVVALTTDRLSRGRRRRPG